MNDENSITAGTKPRRRLRKLKTNCHTRRAVIRIVPISASNAAFLSVIVAPMQLPSLRYAAIIPPILLNSKGGPKFKTAHYRKTSSGAKRFRASRNDRATSSTEGGRCPNDFDRPKIRKTSGDEARHKSGLLRRGSS